MPRRRLATVMPSCAVAMYRSCRRGSRSSVWTEIASLLPVAALADCRARRAHDGELRGHEQGVRQDEQGDDEELGHRNCSFQARVATITEVMTPASTDSISTSVPFTSKRSPCCAGPLAAAATSAPTVSADGRQSPPITCAAWSTRINWQARVRRTTAARSWCVLSSSEDLAEQLREDICNSDQPCDPGILVDDQRLMAAPFPEERQQAIRRHVVADAHDGFQERRERVVPASSDEVRDHVFRVKGAERRRATRDRPANGCGDWRRRS